MGTDGNGDPWDTVYDIDADPSVNNEIVFMVEYGSPYSTTGINGHLYVKGSGTGTDFDQMHLVKIGAGARTFHIKVTINACG